MLYVPGYTVSTLTGSPSGRYKAFESKLQNWLLSEFLYQPDDDPVRVETV
jgi:hypothetical protein